MSIDTLYAIKRILQTLAAIVVALSAILGAVIKLLESGCEEHGSV